jgi:hypothetical protein
MNPTAETGLQLDQIVPLGRSAMEYHMMFDLTSFESDATIVDCGAGPSSLNAELTLKGRQVVSVDPIYGFAASDIKQRIDQTFDGVMEQVEKNRSMYRWGMFRDVGHLKSQRAKSMELFLADFTHGKEEGRYVEASLPELPFFDGRFDVALCSHLLFLYNRQLDFDFHLASIREMMRVAKEARIFPIIGLDGKLSPHLCHIIKQLRGDGFKTQLVNVPYEFQKGANQCLVVKRVVDFENDEVIEEEDV